MKQIFIKFNTAQQVLDFVKLMEQCECQADLKLGSIIVDAKSIVGVFSMARANRLELVLHLDWERLEEEAYKNLMKKVAVFAG